MFFIGVFGINQKMSEIKELPPMMCKSCRQTERLTLFKCYHQFHFFFIPIFKWNVQYYIQCSSCETVANIPLEKGRLLEAGETLELTLWDQEIVEPSEKRKRYCQACHEIVEGNFIYCPFCGQKL